MAGRCQATTIQPDFHSKAVNSCTLLKDGGTSNSEHPPWGEIEKNTVSPQHSRVVESSDRCLVTTKKKKKRVVFIIGKKKTRKSFVVQNNKNNIISVMNLYMVAYYVKCENIPSLIFS